jgi:hypothetical protein
MARDVRLSQFGSSFGLHTRAALSAPSQRRLGGARGSLLRLSPDGQRIIYTAFRDGKSTLWCIELDGSEPTQITDRPSSWRLDRSFDGKDLAYTTGPISQEIILIEKFS